MTASGLETLIIVNSAFFSSPPLGVERPGEAGVTTVKLGIDRVFSRDFKAFTTSPGLSAPMRQRGEVRVNVHNESERSK
jgi:hypothetical protein